MDQPDLWVPLKWGMGGEVPAVSEDFVFYLTACIVIAKLIACVCFLWKYFTRHPVSMGPHVCSLCFADPFGFFENLGQDQIFHKGLGAVTIALSCLLCCSNFIDLAL